MKLRISTFQERNEAMEVYDYFFGDDKEIDTTLLLAYINGYGLLNSKRAEALDTLLTEVEENLWYQIKDFDKRKLKEYGNS